MSSFHVQNQIKTDRYTRRTMVRGGSLLSSCFKALNIFISAPSPAYRLFFSPPVILAASSPEFSLFQRSRIKGGFKTALNSNIIYISSFNCHPIKEGVCLHHTPLVCMWRPATNYDYLVCKVLLMDHISNDYINENKTVEQYVKNYSPYFPYDTALLRRKWSAHWKPPYGWFF